MFMRNFVVTLALAAMLPACGLKGPLIKPKPAADPAGAPAAATPAAPAGEKKTPGTVSP
jgi:predicted small lipoprotein YifL